MRETVMVLGSSGMAGHMIARYLEETAEVDVLEVGPRTKVSDRTLLCDLSAPGALDRLLDETRPGALVNCVGVLVKASEERKDEAVWINAYLPRLLAKACVACGCRLIHLSSDCVFSGRDGPYGIRDACDAEDFYGRTKILGEVREAPALSVRTSIIGPALRPGDTGLFGWYTRQRGQVPGYVNALWSGVTTLELAKFLRFVIMERRDLSGLIHYAVDGGISKYALLSAIRSEFGTGARVIPSAEPRIDRRLAFDPGIAGMTPESYEVQLAELRRWMDARGDLYGTHGDAA
ncbi:MAG: sugar nucleotide-binding protein [Spirochaetales bacterium]|nr:sugar nucleotide-binding protein [Spirochaetales bacterium]